MHRAWRAEHPQAPWQAHAQMVEQVETVSAMLIQIKEEENGVKLLEDFSEVSMQHLMALDRRTINLWGESSGKTIPIRMKRDCIYNVSSSSIYGLNSIRSRDASDQANRVKVIP